MSARALRVAVVAGEASGDQLGAKLIDALRGAHPGKIDFAGVGGPAMAGAGFSSLFPLSDIAVMGFVPVIRRLPSLLRRIAETARKVVAFAPDALVVVDSPDFTHRVARRVRAALPGVPILDYVCPSVWAWRPGRARTMRTYVDEVLCLLPFEEGALARLEGPPGTYVGHPLVERLAELRPDGAGLLARERELPTVLVLPGSRRSEIERLMPDFGAAVALLQGTQGPIDFVLPAVDHVRERIETALAGWPVRPRLVDGEAAKLAAFRSARAALAASGTVTLELALAGVPQVVAYRVSRIEELLKYVIKVPSIVLPNLVLGTRAVPEFIQGDCTPSRLAETLGALLDPGPVRDAQRLAFERLDELMRPAGGRTPSEIAAARVLAHIGRRGPVRVP